MKIKSTRNLNKLKRQLTGLACIDLIAISPNYVVQYLEKDLTDPTKYKLPESVANNSEFQKWRTISIDLIDVEF
jgi:hypothetical protein